MAVRLAQHATACRLYGAASAADRYAPVAESLQQLDFERATPTVSPAFAAAAAAAAVLPKPIEGTHGLVVTTEKQTEVRRADGKRRITPISVCVAAPASAALPPPQQQQHEAGRTLSHGAPVSAAAVRVDRSADRPLPNTASPVPALKRQRSAAPSAAPAVRGCDGPAPAATLPLPKLPSPPLLARRIGRVMLTATNDAAGATSTLVCALTTAAADGDGQVRSSSLLGSATGTAPVTHWTNFVRSAAIAIAGCEGVAYAVAFSDQTLRLFSRSGRLIAPRIRLQAPAAFLCASPPPDPLAAAPAAYIGVVLADLHVHVWDVSAAPKALVCASAAGVADEGVRVVALELTARGMPALTLSSGDVCLYSADMRCWLLISDASVPTPFPSPFAHGLCSAHNPLERLPLAHVAAAAALSATSALSDVRCTTSSPKLSCPLCKACSCPSGLSQLQCLLALPLCQ